MLENEKLVIAAKTGQLFANGYHCSEALLLGMGEHLQADLIPQDVRLATPFAGGVGSTHYELCGAFTGGLMVIGLLYGRVRADSDDTHCQEMASAWRSSFLRRFGWLKCQELKDNWMGNTGQPDCRALVERAANCCWSLWLSRLAADDLC
jgi:C_GCAxxG_C_C family probable redox protein